MRPVEEFKGCVSITYARPRNGHGRVLQVDNGTAFSDEQLVAIEKFGKELEKLLINGKPIQTASPAARPDGPRRYTPRNPGPSDLKVPEKVDVAAQKKERAPVSQPLPRRPVGPGDLIASAGSPWLPHE
jgi:hypothetical protein